MIQIDPQYDAFISYNHGADGELAPAVERGLQRLAKPWYRLRALSIFRDMSDTGLNPSMWDHVQRQLDRSRFLIVLACPESAASLWVQQEVDYWCEHRGLDSILIVLTGGEIVWDRDLGGFSDATTALTPGLASRYTSEPLHLDLRWTRDVEQPSLALAQFRADMARLASPIRGLPPAEIEGEDIELHRKARRLARGAVAVLVTLAIIATVAAVIAVVNARRAERRAREATARQVGLLALDLPASDLDAALLLSVVASDLDPDVGTERFRATRTLIGRHSRLTSLLHAAPGEDVDASLRGVAVSGDGSRVVAFGSIGDGGPRTFGWDIADRPIISGPMVSNADDGIGPSVDVASDGTVVLGAPGEMLAVADGETVVAPPGRVLDLDADAGRAVVAGAASVRLVDLSSGDEIATWPTSAGSEHVRAAVSDGLVAVVIDGSLSVVDAATGADVAAAEVGPVAALAVDEDRVAIVSPDGGVELSTVDRGDAGAGSSPDADADADADAGVRVDVGNPLGIALADVDRAADRVVVIGDAGLAIADAATGSVVATDLATGELALDPTRRFAAVGGSRLSVWDLARGQRVIAVSEKVNAMAWSECVSGVCRLVTAGEALDVWEPMSGRRIRLGDQTNAQAVDITDDGGVVVSGGWGSAVAVWDLTIPIDDSGRVQLAAPGRPSAVDPVTGTTASVDGDDGVVVMDEEQESRFETGPVDRMHLLLDGMRLLVFHDGGRRLFDVGESVEIEIDARCVGSQSAVSPAGAHVLFHDAATGATVVCSSTDGAFVAGAIVDATTAPTTSVAVDDEGSVALGGNGFVVFHRRDGQTLAGGRAVDVRFAGESVAVTSTALDRGRMVAGLRPLGIDAPARVLIWDAAIDGTPVQFDTDHRDVPAVALLGDDSELVVSAGALEPGGDVVVQVWERETRRRLGRGLGGLTGEIVRLGGDATAAVGTDASGASYRWSLESDPRREVCGIVGRSLRIDEWSSIAQGTLDRYEFTPVCGGDDGEARP